MGSFIAQESIVVGTSDILRNKSYNLSDSDRVIEDVGVFVATLAQVTAIVMKVGQKVVLELDVADGTTLDVSKLHDVSIDVPAGQKITCNLTVITATTVCQLVLNIEDLDEE